jgi:type II secretory pathway predicted ATPase ExeA
MDQHGAAAGRRSAATAMASPIAHLFAAQQAALGELMTGMDADTRWALILGPEGSGKSTVVRALLDELRLATTAVAVFDARETPDVEHLGAGLRDQLGLPNKRKFLADDHSVSDIVASRSEIRTPLVVVVDDADALSSTSVKWLAGLAASASRPETACYVVLVGAPELQDSASHAWARGGSGRASVCCILEPMTSTEVRRYIEQWRHSRGDTWVKFSDAAMQKIEMYAKGRPGLIGELCSHAVTLPGTRVTEQVSVEAVVETAERLGLGRASGSAIERESRIERGSSRRVAGWAVLAIGAATLAALLGYVGLTRVGPTLIARATGWLGLSVPAIDRSTSDVTRSRREETRREPGVATGRATGGTAAVALPPRPSREPRPAEATPRPMAMAPAAQQVAALMERARDGEVGELTRLVSAGVSPNVRDASGFTPLMVAVVNDQVPAARALLDRGADINAWSRGGITALMLSVINDRPNAVKLLLERDADVNAQSGAGWTALTFAVWKGDAGVVRALLSHGAKPNVIDKQGWTPLDYAPPKLPPTDTASDAQAGTESGAPESTSQNPAEPR